MKCILTHKKKDGTEYKYKSELEAHDKTKNIKLIAEGKLDQCLKDGITYREGTKSIIACIEGKMRTYFTESATGQRTSVIVKTGTKDDPRQKYLTTAISEGQTDNLLLLPTYA